jgi:hypothetical protein
MVAETSEEGGGDAQGATAAAGVVHQGPKGPGGLRWLGRPRRQQQQEKAKGKKAQGSGSCASQAQSKGKNKLVIGHFQSECTFDPLCV